MSPSPGSNPGSGPRAEGATTQAAKDVASEASDQTGAVVGTTADEVRDVAAHAREQLGTVTDEARDQAHKVVSTATAELTDQLDQRLGDAVGTARSTANELRALADGRVDEAGRTGELVRQAGERLEHFADRVDHLGVRGVTEEITDFARRRPAAFLFSAAALGIMVGRLARAGKEASDDESTSASMATDPSQPGTAPPLGLQGRLPTAENDPIGAPVTMPETDQASVPGSTASPSAVGTRPGTSSFGQVR